MKNLSKTIKNILMLFIISMVWSCAPGSNHEFVKIADEASSSKINFNSDEISSLYEIEFVCLNKEHFSADSFQLIVHKMIPLADTKDLVVTKTQDGFTLKKEDRKIHSTLFPEDAKSRMTSMTNMNTACSTIYNELFRIEYTLNESGSEKRVKTIGYSNALFTQDEGFHWDYFLTNKDNLYNIYKQNPKCDHPWEIKI